MADLELLVQMEAGEPETPVEVSQREKRNKELELIMKMCIKNHFTGLLQGVGRVKKKKKKANEKMSQRLP